MMIHDNSSKGQTCWWMYILLFARWHLSASILHQPNFMRLEIPNKNCKSSKQEHVQVLIRLYKWRINLLIWKGLVTYTRFTPVATLHIPPRCHVYMFQVSSKAQRSKNALSPRILVPRCGEAATSRTASDPLGWRYGGVQRSRPLMSQGAKQQKTGGKKLEPKSCKLMFKDVEIATFSWNFCFKSTWTTWWLGKTWSISKGFGLISRFCMLHLSSKILRSRAAPAEAYRELGIAEAP